MQSSVNPRPGRITVKVGVSGPPPTADTRFFLMPKPVNQPLVVPTPWARREDGQ